MPEVNVEINGRKYRMACEEGQEAHLGNPAERFNQPTMQPWQRKAKASGSSIFFISSRCTGK